MKYYFDDPEVGPARETSHPNFSNRLKSDLYYDCMDEFSPFGNDDGADTLCDLEDWYSATEGRKSILKWVFGYIDEMGFEYASEDAHKLLIDENAVSEMGSDDHLFFRTIDNVVIAAAFGQYKITGQIDDALKAAALLSIKRMKTIATADNPEYLDEFRGAYDQMEKDLALLPDTN